VVTTGPRRSAPVVVGLAWYASPEPAAVFVNSFAAHRQDAELCLLVDRRHLAAWRPLEQPWLRLHPIRPPSFLWTDRRSKFWLRRGLHAAGVSRAVAAVDRRRARRSRPPLAPFFEYPNVWRLGYTLELLAGSLADARWVLLSDVRDAAFQADFEPVFDELATAAPLHLFEEAENLGSPSDLVGLPAIEHLTPTPAGAGRPILCSGTILGTPAALAVTVERMLGALAIVPRATPRILDQGALNLVYYTGRLDDLGPVAHAVGDGGILTVGLAKTRGELTLDYDGARWAGALPPIVHQFDRVPALAEFYRTTYG